MDKMKSWNEEYNVMAAEWFRARINSRLTLLQNIEAAIAETIREERAQRETKWPDIKPAALYFRMAALEQMREAELSG